MKHGLKLLTLFAASMLVASQADAAALIEKFNSVSATSGAYGIYNADTNLFDMSSDMSGQSKYLLQLQRNESPFDYVESGFHGENVLVFSVSEDGTVGPGVFTLTGVMPGLGIFAPTLLVTGIVTGGTAGMDEQSFTCPPNLPPESTCPGGTEQGAVDFRINLSTVSVNAALLPFWQSNMFVGFIAHTNSGAGLPFPSSPMNNDTVFHYSWAGQQQDYWALGTYGSSLPEPGTLALASVALLGVVATRRRSRTIPAS